MAKSATKLKGAAPGQYLGYALQPVRLCHHLLECEEDASVSLEVLDDIAIHRSSGDFILEQTKSALSQNPVSDWSIDLWKTFSNWVDNIDAGDIDINSTTFQLYVTPVKDGNWVQRLSDARSKPEINALIAEIGEGLSKLDKKPKAYKYLKKLLDADPAVQNLLIRNFRFVSNENDPVEPISQRISLFVQSHALEACCKYAIGAAKVAADTLIRKKNLQSFQLRPFVKKFAPSSINTI